jgi:hypothetical protein
LAVEELVAADGPEPPRAAGRSEVGDVVGLRLAARDRPDGLREETFPLDDSVTFVTQVELADGPEVLRQPEAFQRYRATLDERCDESPVMTTLHTVGSYGFR